MKKLLSIVVVICLIASTLIGCFPPDTGIKLSSKDDKTDLMPGESIELSVDIDTAFEYEIKEGESYATIANNKLTVKQDAPVGSKVKVVAKNANAESNVLTFTVVDIVLKSISAMVNTTSLLPGGEANLSYTLNPLNTTQTNIRWDIVNDYRYAKIEGDKLIIDDTEDVPTGEVEIQASFNDIKSNKLTVEVVSASGINLHIDADDSMTIKNFSDEQNAVFSVDVTDDDGYSVADANITFEIIEGHRLIEITPNGYDCGIDLLGHGIARIVVKIDNVPMHTLTVNCIKTPTMIELPAYIKDKIGQDYKVGKEQPVDFAVTIADSIENYQACEIIDYTFEMVDNAQETDIAEYQDGKITFLKTGKIKVTATTNSGNTNKEKRISREFIVNEGKNVSSWEEARTELQSKAHSEVNFTITQKPNGWDAYSLVPQIILDGKDELDDFARYTFSTDYTIHEWYLSINISESITINANNHPIDFSNLKKMKDKTTPINHRINPVLNISNDTKPLDVELNDLQIWGNIEVDGSVSSDRSVKFDKDSGDVKLIRVHSQAIVIGTTAQQNTYNINMNNVEVTNFHVGIRICHAFEGSLAKNVRVADCYTNGIEVSACQMEFESLKVGLCGATGIELTPEASNQAGASFNQQQKITFSGKLEVNNPNAGNTQYMLDYIVMGITVPQVVTKVLGQYNDIIQKHIVNAAKEFMFIAFIFNDLEANPPINHSTLTCYNEINIGDMADNEINAVKEFIRIPVVVPELGPMGQIGYILVRNWQYIPNAVVD